MKAPQEEESQSVVCTPRGETFLRATDLLLVTHQALPGKRALQPHALRKTFLTASVKEKLRLTHFYWGPWREEEAGAKETEGKGKEVGEEGFVCFFGGRGVHLLFAGTVVGRS